MNDKDKVLKWLIFPSIFVSAYFTAKVLWGLWASTGAWDEGIVVLAGAIFITAAEIYCFRRSVLRNGVDRWVSLTLGTAIATVSIVGSFGAFQTGFVRNLLHSDSYTTAHRAVDNLDRQIEAKQRQADKFAAEGQTWNERDARRELMELNIRRNAAYNNMKSASENGMVEGNAVYSGVGAYFSLPQDEAARRMNGWVAIIVEVIMIAMVVWDAKDEKSPRLFQSKTVIQTPTNGEPAKKNSNSNEGGVPGGNLNAANDARQKKKLRRMIKLARYLVNNPDAEYSQMMSKIGVSSRDTVRKDLAAIDDEGGPQPFLTKYDDFDGKIVMNSHQNGHQNWA